MTQIAQPLVRNILEGNLGELAEYGRKYVTMTAQYHLRGKAARRQLARLDPRLEEAIARSLAVDIAEENRSHVEAIETRRQAIRKSDEQINTSISVPADDGLEIPLRDRSDTQKAVADLPMSQPFTGVLLYNTIRSTSATKGIELGTSAGIAAAYQGLGMAATGGELITIEGSPEVAAVANDTIKALDLKTMSLRQGLFQDILEQILPDGPYDWAFIDGNHSREATLGYFDRLYPHLTSSAVLMFDDLRWSVDMERAWEALQTDPRVDLSLDLGGHGIVVVKTDMDEQANLTIPITQKNYTVRNPSK